tara:strand:- start:591 stop:869 length:279 start_codon:yes stop_codon:yes gene_type:complete
MTHKISITFTDDDQKLLNDSIINIKEWVELAVVGETNRSWKKFHAHWTDVLLNDSSFTDGIPSNKKDFTDLIVARSDYKTSKQIFDERKASR